MKEIQIGRLSGNVNFNTSIKNDIPSRTDES